MFRYTEQDRNSAHQWHGNVTTPRQVQSMDLRVWLVELRGIYGCGEQVTTEKSRALRVVSRSQIVAGVTVWLRETIPCGDRGPYKRITRR